MGQKEPKSCVLKPVFFVSLLLCLETAFWKYMPSLLPPEDPPVGGPASSAFSCDIGSQESLDRWQRQQQAAVTGGHIRSLQRERAKERGAESQREKPCFTEATVGPSERHAGNAEL